MGWGTGYFPWQRNPAMDDHLEWAYFGVVAAVVGLGIIWFSQR